MSWASFLILIGWTDFGKFPARRFRIQPSHAYLCGMSKVAFEPCIPTRGTTVPTGEDWLHEIKHDGYRLIVQRDGQRVRLFTRNGHDWTDRYPLIVEAALRNRAPRLYSTVKPYCSELTADPTSTDCTAASTMTRCSSTLSTSWSADGEDVRKLPLSMRKTNLSRLLARRVDGIFLSDFEQGEIGPDLFRHACLMGLEGLVSKHNDRPYRAGRSPHWIKMKNPKHPAMTRVQDVHR